MMMGKLGLVVLVALFAPVAVYCRKRIFEEMVLPKKAGECPYQRPAVNCEHPLFFAEHDNECFDDGDCQPLFKCCQTGCDSKCVEPVHYREWCRAPVDLAILFDTQATVWESVKKMVTDVIDKMSISKSATHVSLRTIAEDSELLLKFNTLKGSHLNGTNVLRIVNSVEAQETGGQLSAALQLAKDMFKESNGGRQDAIKVLLVVSDADADEDESLLLESASQALKDSGILVQTVGISTEMSLFNLVAIATSDIYVWNGVDAEMLGGLKKLEKEPCPEI